MEPIDVPAKDLGTSDLPALKSPANQSPLPTNFRRHLVLGALFMLIGFGGFIGWALYAPIDSGATTSGSVVLDSRRKTLQHLSGGVVKKIFVKEGESVKAGTVLIHMDDSVALANKSSTEAQMRTLEIQVTYLDKLINDIAGMAQEGFYPRNRLLEMQARRAEAASELEGLKDKLAAATIDLERAVIRSPVKGRVMGLSISTDGGVIPPGGKLMDIVPDEERLVIEVQIQPHLIEKVIPGLETEVRFSALNMRVTPVILGHVEWVSADKFQNPEDQMNPMGYYMARVVVEKEDLSKIIDAQLRPGMPVEAIIKTGERTFFEYLVKPLTDRMATSLKEQ